MTAVAPDIIENHNRPFYALMLRLAAIFCFSMMSIVVKLLGDWGVALPEIVFWRQAFALPVIIVALMMGAGLASLRTRQLNLHAARTATGLISMACAFGGITLLSVTEATTISFVAPIFATLIGILWFGEKIGIRRVLAIAAGFMGVLIAMQPSGKGFDVLGSAVALCGALMVAVVTHQIKEMSKSEPAMSIVFWFTALSTLAMIGFMPIYATSHDAGIWVALLAMGSIGGVAQMFMTNSLKYAPVSTVVGMDYSALLWAAASDWWIWNHVPGAFTWAGAVIIASSGLYIVWREHRLQIERAREHVA